MPLVPPRNLIYQIFPDRYAADGGEPLPTEAARAASAEVAGADALAPWKVHAGGTLNGVVDRLPHLEALGADCVYLTPVFEAPSNHKYDATSFDRVDPCFGGDAAFDRLAAACAGGGMGLVLDGVFNHVGDKHEWFASASGAGGIESVHRPYFKWLESPGGYSSWRGHGHMPELDLSHGPVTDALWDADESVLLRWLRRGATGWRLDCANDLGLARCEAIMRAARSGRAPNPDGVVGEVMNYGEEWVAEGRLDGVMNYYFRETVLGLATGDVPAAQAAHNLKRMARRFRYGALLRSWNMLGSHDTPRLRHIIPEFARRAFLMTLAFVYPGIPVVYYGDEIGMEGGPDPDNRRPMVWDEAMHERAMFMHVKSLAKTRKACAALREGDYVTMPQPGHPELLAFARTIPGRPAETVVVVANSSDRTVRARVFAPDSHLFDSLLMRDALGLSATSRMVSGRFDIELQPWAVGLFSPDESLFPGYSFFR